jgi:hypothetical protein
VSELLAPVSGVYLTDRRLALGEALAGEPPDLTLAPSIDGIKALPALIIEPANAWLDGATDSGPGRVVRYQIEARVIVNAQEPIGALGDLESVVELVLERIPLAWRFDRGDAPVRVQASGGELTAIAARLYLSTRYSIN